MPALYSLRAERGDRVTDILPGQLAHTFGVSILDAALLSWLALRALATTGVLSAFASGRSGREV